MTTIRTKGILFDMDGTLVDSTPGVIQAWKSFSIKYGLDAKTVTDATHGTRVVDSLRLYCKITDEAELQSEVRRFENEVLAATVNGEGITVLPGVHRLLEQITTVEHAHPKWAIVTSATSTYVPEALKAAHVPLPEALITADRVTKGKPHPEPYLAGAAACGLDPADCIVVEDAPSGIRAAQAAGSRVLAVCTSHTREALLTSRPDWIVTDLSRVSARWDLDALEMKIDETP